MGPSITVKSLADYFVYGGCIVQKKDKKSSVITELICGLACFLWNISGHQIGTGLCDLYIILSWNCVGKLH